jgi:hypothetical protein
MNGSRVSGISSSESQLIADALGGLRKSAGITGRLLGNGASTDAKASLKVSLTIAGKSLQYDCQVER